MTPTESAPAYDMAAELLGAIPFAGPFLSAGVRLAQRVQAAGLTPEAITRIDVAQLHTLEADADSRLDARAAEHDRAVHVELTVRQSPAGLVRMLAHGGRIVSTSELTPTDIAIARANDRMWVDANGYGYVYLPSNARAAEHDRGIPPSDRTPDRRATVPVAPRPALGAAHTAALLAAGHTALCASMFTPNADPMCLACHPFAPDVYPEEP